MTISNEHAREDYTGTGLVKIYPYEFKIFDQADIDVIRTIAGVDTTLAIGVDYIVDGVGLDAGGNVTLTVNLAAAAHLAIVRNLQFIQPTDIKNQGEFFPEVHEDVFDRLVMIDQQQQDAIDRSLKFSASEPGSAANVLPNVASRAGKFLAFDPVTGAPIAAAGVSGSPATAFGAALIAAVNAAAAFVVLGFSAFFQTLVAAANATAFQLAIGISAFVSTLLGAASAKAFCDLLNLSTKDSAFLTHLLYIQKDAGWRDVYRAGWLPWAFNHQWGGAQVGHEIVSGHDGVLYKFDAATGFVEDNSAFNVADAAARTYIAQGFKLSETESITAVWVKIYKVANPANNLTVRILPDDGTGTKPTLNVPVLNGTATAQSGKLHTSKTDGEWVRFVFPVAPALVAGTIYHLVLSSSGAVDATNYWVWKASLTVKKYPFGNKSAGDAVPAWTADTTSAICFMVENIAPLAFLQSGGMFDGAFVFKDSTPLNQSKAIVRPMKDFLDGRNFTCLIRGNSWPKDKTIADFSYGYDHDRIVVRANAGTGFCQVDLYTSNGTHVAITAAATDLSAINSDIGILCRMYNDGADYIKLYVNGALAAQLLAQSFSFDQNFRDLGHATIGGGFNLPVAFTNTYDMTALPSAAAGPATWTGVATEGLAMSVSGGKLYQNRGGYTALQDGYYLKAAAGLSNANGWAMEFKLRVSFSNNTVDTRDVIVQVEDGAKGIGVEVKEHYIEVINAPFSAGYAKIQGDFKNVENVFLMIGKGSDFYLICNGRLIYDGTGIMTTASANNQIGFGDMTTISGESSDAIWDYFKYYVTAAPLPQFAHSASLSEIAFWSGDKSALLNQLYNAGAFISVKQFCGGNRNYIGESYVFRKEQVGLSNAPTNASATFVLKTDMEMFCVGSDISVLAEDSLTGSTNATATQVPRIDGVYRLCDQQLVSITSTWTQQCVHENPRRQVHLGLHKVDVADLTSAGTLTRTSTLRNLITEVKS